MNKHDDLQALKKRARELGYEIDPSVRRLGYCLWRSWPGVGRQMVLGGNDGVALDAIAEKLDEVEAEEMGKQGSRKKKV
jgi:hypothetical protein